MITGSTEEEDQSEALINEATKIENSCGLKTKESCMFAGTSQGDEQDLQFVEEEKLNLKFVHINAEIARS